MALSTITKLGDILCEAASFIRKELGVDNSLINKLDDVCNSILPDLEHLEDSEAGKLAEAAYDMAQRVKKSLHL